MDSPALFQWTALGASVVAACWDARTGRIPNWLTLPLLPLALVVSGVSAGLAAAGWALGGVFACGLVPLFLHRASRGRGIGGGDVKLFAALGALLGPVKGLEVEFGAFVVLATFALVRLAYEGKLLAVLRNTLVLAASPLLPARWRPRAATETLTEMRLGPAIAISCLAALYLTDLVEPWLA